MSIRLMSLVWEADLGSPVRKLVMMRLADFSNDDGDNIFPSVARIAKDCSVDERTVKRTLAAFRAEGLLHVIATGGWDGQKNTTTHYRLQVRLLAKMAGVVTESPPRGDRESPTVVTQRPHRGGTESPKPSIEPSQQPETPEVGVSARERAPNDRGTRLPKDWSLPDDWKTDGLAFLKDETLLALEADKFRDYWLSLPGPKGRKLDWKRTWLNWCRNAKPARRVTRGAEIDRDELPAWRRDQLNRFDEWEAALRGSA